MHLFYYTLFGFFAIATSRIAFSLSTLNNNPASLYVISSRNYGVTVYSSLQARIQHLVDSRFASMNESANNDYAKNFNWNRELESVTQRLQREQREALSSEVQSNTYSASLNLEALALFIKLFTFCLFLALSAFYTNYHFFFSISNTNVIAAITGFWALDVIFTRLVLSESSFWFWSPWPAIFHVYANGFWHFKTGMVLFTYYFLPSFWTPFIILSVVFFSFSFNHSPLMSYAYNVWGGYWRSQFWYYIMVIYFKYASFLNPAVMLLTSWLKPVLVWVWRSVPSFSLPPGWSWL